MKIQHVHGAAEGRSGIALIYALFGTFVAAGMVSVMFTMSAVAGKHSELRRDEVQARYLADGAVEAAKKVLAESVANWDPVPAAGTAQIGDLQVPWTITATGDDHIVEDSAGIQTLVDGYEIAAVATLGDATLTSRRLVEARSTPVFQFAVFYTNDLEVQPGPNMTLGGRVHTNGDMYLGCGNTLTLNTNYVKATGKIYRRRKDNSDSPGTVQVRRWVENPFDGSEPTQYVNMNSRGQMSGLGISTPSGYDSAFTGGYDADGDGNFYGPDDWMPFAAGALDLWCEPDGYAGGEGYTVQTGAHGVTEAATPSIGSISMYESVDGGAYAFDDDSGEYVLVGAGNGTHEMGFYHANAGLAILVSEDGSSWTAHDAQGNDVTAALQATGAVVLDGVPDMRQSGSTNNDTPVVSVDLALLHAGGMFPGNGLLYTSHYGMGTGTDAKGVLLHNGSDLGGKLTVVTEGAAYVQGDYNTVNKKGAAVIGDAVNLLSNAWTNTKTAGSLPGATDTTFNCAMITGNYATEGSTYNGGLENLPRFHENWSGKNANITGSFVNTWESSHATGLWVYGSDRYQAPRRNWNYDTAFNRVANLPPFTPMAVTTEDVVSW